MMCPYFDVHPVELKKGAFNRHLNDDLLIGRLGKWNIFGVLPFSSLPASEADSID